LAIYFSDLYATASFPSPNKPAFPLLLGEENEIYLQTVPKHGVMMNYDSRHIGLKC